jgi:hypothetical protein
VEWRMEDRVSCAQGDRLKGDLLQIFSCDEIEEAEHSLLLAIICVTSCRMKWDFNPAA